MRHNFDSFPKTQGNNVQKLLTTFLTFMHLITDIDWCHAMNLLFYQLVSSSIKKTQK